ncbi:MAG: hypothetical protein CRN43_22665 [Candidatus Nephrothrix sp. EaCA]|nr:MAG: hypothetical protein CRN43_22665 [Candidatus Nephrothrix sp. EaCA]
MRTNKLPRRDKNHPLKARFLELNKTPKANYATFQKAIEHENPKICVNTMIMLITLTVYLLRKQMKAPETAFVLVQRL